MTIQNDSDTSEPTGDVGSLDSRAALALEQIQNADTEPPEAAPVEAASTPAAKADPAAPEAAATERTPDAVAAERRERIAAREAEIQKIAEDERARFAASRARRNERAPEPAPAAPPQITDAASFFAHAERLAIPPQELASWLTGQGDPSRAAELASRKALSPVEAKLAEIERRQAEWESRQVEAQERAQTDALVRQNTQILLGHLDTVKSDAPRSAAFHAEAPEEFLAAVHSVCNAMPPGFTAQDVVDRIEENLTRLRAFGPASAALPASTTKRTSSAATARANVGNQIAAERATIVEADDNDVVVDLEGRARQLKARLAAG